MNARPEHPAQPPPPPAGGPSNSVLRLLDRLPISAVLRPGSWTELGKADTPQGAPFLTRQMLPSPEKPVNSQVEASMVTELGDFTKPREGILGNEKEQGKTNSFLFFLIFVAEWPLV